MRKLLFAIVGIVGVTIGVLAGVLLAPRKGSETREEIVRRSRPLQDAAKSSASRMGKKIGPVVKLASDRLPRGARGKIVSQEEEKTAEGGGQHSGGTSNGRHAEPEKVGSIR